MRVIFESVYDEYFGAELVPPPAKNKRENLDQSRKEVWNEEDKSDLKIESIKPLMKINVQICQLET